MKVTLFLSWVTLALAASESSSSSSSSTSSSISLSSSSIASNSSSSSSSSAPSSSSSSSTVLSSSSSSSVPASSSSSSTSQSSSSSSSSVQSSSFSSLAIQAPLFTLGATVTTSSALSLTSSGSASATALSVLAVSTAFGNSTIANSTAAPTPTGPVSYVNPWAGNYSGTVPPTGTGSDYALQCQNAYYSFTSINSDFISATASLYNLTSVIRSTTVIEVHTYYTTSFYTLCDGHPRVITSMPTATSTTVLPPSTTVLLAQGVSWASLNDPNCTVSWDDCAKLWSTYSSASSVYDSVSFAEANTVVSLGPGASFWVVSGVTTTFPTAAPQTISLGDEYIHLSPPAKSVYIIVTTPPPGGLFLDDGYHMTAGGAPVTIVHTIDFTQTPYTPHCRTEKPTCTANQRCQIGGDRVEVFYFPPKTNVTRDMCATAPVGNGVISRPPTNFTWTEITTGPYTVLPGGTTWYSGNVYVSLNRISAECTWSGVPVEVGDEHGGQILTMAPSELFSQRAFPITTGSQSGMFDFEPYAYSFNFADLQEPYPWSAWDGAPECVIDQCTMINGSYNPWIAVPEAIRRLDPTWATCDLALYGLYDPPRALSSVGNIFATLTTTTQKQEPTPGQPAQSQVQPTKTADPPSPGQSDPPQPPVPGQSDTPVPNDPPDTTTPVDPPADPPAPNDPPAASNPSGNNPPTNNPPTNSAPATNPNDPANPNNPTNPNNPSDPNNPTITSPPVVIPPAPTTIGSIGTTAIVLDPSKPTQIIIGTTTLAPGSPGLTVSGTTITMPDPTHIIVSAPGQAAPSTINVPQPVAAAPTQGVVVTLPGGEVITATAIPGPSGSSIVVSGTLLSEGGPAVTLSNGVVISEAPSGSGIVVINPTGGSSTLPFSAVPGIANPIPTAGVVLTLPNGEVVTATAIPGPQGSSLIVSGTILSVGGPAITLSNGVVISEAPSGTGIVVINPSSGATSTIPFSSVSGLAPTVTGGAPHPTDGAVITVGGKTYTVISSSGTIYIPGLGVTLSEGGTATTINGTVVSDAGTGVIVGTTTQPFSTVTVTDGPGGTSTGVGADFTGAAARIRGVFGERWWCWIPGWTLGMVVMGGGVLIM